MGVAWGRVPWTCTILILDSGLWILDSGLWIFNTEFEVGIMEACDISEQRFVTFLQRQLYLLSVKRMRKEEPAKPALIKGFLHQVQRSQTTAKKAWIQIWKAKSRLPL